MDPAEGHGTQATSLGREMRLCRTQNTKTSSAIGQLAMELGTMAALIRMEQSSGSCRTGLSKFCALQTHRHLQGVAYTVLGTLALQGGDASFADGGRTSPGQRPARFFGFCRVACTGLAPGNSSTTVPEQSAGVV
ncbi:hypothetical protein TgHK011_006015 [Trichoderma gracile]|nr:hypothetical protein TgHK011_006015 [Trichoderma gracile]